ncbi:peptide MFS transporter [Capnocytophaga sputigena]|uniref:peptide MFS transporter n=1 Tax=Capnocytophaga sputigena TaxID=1019 RepID=UPI0028D8F380|nr:peptide MFS transporter [Capnocytophaga sputigena]
MNTNVENEKKKHPKGLYLVFLTGMWERFSYYGMRGILMLYLTKTWLEGGLAFDPSTASLIYGFATGLTYFTPLIGGWIADNFLGQRRAVLLGGFIMFLGEAALFSWTSHAGLYLGLFLLIIGNGFFKPNISALVGGLYESGDKRLDSAFSIFYMGINLGAFLAPLITGLLTDNIFAKTAIDANTGEVAMSFGYKFGFGAAAIGMLIGELIFIFFAQKYLGDLGLKAKGSSKKVVELSEAEAHKPLTKEEKERITVIFVYFFFAIFFFAGFEQAGSSLTLYTDSYINRVVGSFEIPTAWFQSVNPLFIVLLAPVFATFWGTKMGQRLTTPFKMGLGMILLGVGFFFMLGAVYERGGAIGVDPKDVAVKASLAWLILTYLTHTIGELCLSPVGLSTVTKLSPPRLAGLLMGVWMMAAFFANSIGGVIASYVEKLGASVVFAAVSGFVILCGLGMILLNKKLQAMMHGVK